MIDPIEWYRVPATIIIPAQKPRTVFSWARATRAGYAFGFAMMALKLVDIGGEVILSQGVPLTLISLSIYFITELLKPID